MLVNKSVAFGKSVLTETWEVFTAVKLRLKRGVPDADTNAGEQTGQLLCWRPILQILNR